MALVLKYVGNKPGAKQINSGSSTNEGEGIMIDGAAAAKSTRGLGAPLVEAMMRSWRSCQCIRRLTIYGSKYLYVRWVQEP